MTHIIGIFNIVKVFQGQEKKKKKQWKKPSQLDIQTSGNIRRVGKVQKSLETMQCISQVQVLATNVAKKYLCTLLTSP